MENNNLFSGEKRKGFTIVEMAIVILILGIMASVMTFSPEIAKQTAKREAERLQKYIYKMVDIADRRHMNFELEIGPIVETGKIELKIRWINSSKTNPYGNYETFTPTAGCSYRFTKTTTSIKYNARNKRPNPFGTIEVTDANGEKHYVIFAGVNEGRIRLSETEPES